MCRWDSWFNKQKWPWWKCIAASANYTVPVRLRGFTLRYRLVKCNLLTDTQGWLRICAAVYRASAFTCNIRLINSFIGKKQKKRKKKNEECEESGEVYYNQKYCFTKFSSVQFLAAWVRKKSPAYADTSTSDTSVTSAEQTICPLISGVCWTARFC